MAVHGEILDGENLPGNFRKMAPGNNQVNPRISADCTTNNSKGKTYLYIDSYFIVTATLMSNSPFAVILVRWCWQKFPYLGARC